MVHHPGRESDGNDEGRGPSLEFFDVDPVDVHAEPLEGVPEARRPSDGLFDVLGSPRREDPPTGEQDLRDP